MWHHNGVSSRAAVCLPCCYSHAYSVAPQTPGLHLLWFWPLQLISDRKDEGYVSIPQPQATSNLFFISVHLLTTLSPHENGVIQCLTLFDRLISLSIMSLRFIHVVAGV